LVVVLWDWWRLGRRACWTAWSRTRVGGGLRRLLEARRAEEERLLSRPFMQAVECRPRHWDRNERSLVGASVGEMPLRAVWAEAQVRWKERTLGWLAPVVSVKHRACIYL